jgi:hypothetical protein
MSDNKVELGGTGARTRKPIAYLGDELGCIVSTCYDSPVEVLDSLPKPHANDQEGRQA